MPVANQPSILGGKDEEVKGYGIKAGQGWDLMSRSYFEFSSFQREVDRVLEEIHEQNR